jgi:hypothetical protein
LKCGTNNCDTTQGFPSAYDCCYDPATTGGMWLTNHHNPW